MHRTTACDCILATLGLAFSTATLSRDLSPTLAQSSSGGWRLAAPMIVPRAGHSATLLPSGLVLVAGGWTKQTPSGQPGSTLDSAEVHDSGTGTWSLVGQMGTRRLLHAAVALPSGQVLVAGGGSAHPDHPDLIDLQAPVTSAELFDPVTGTWTATGSMARTRRGPGVLLPDGRVLMAGTETDTGSNLHNAGPECEVYDPATGIWAETGSMNVPRSGPALVVLPSGLVLAVGGTAWNSYYPSAAAELYDPSTGTWRITASLDYGVRDHVLLLLPTGEVLLASGRLDDCSPTTVEPRQEGRLFDPMHETWRPTAPMTYRRDRAAGVVLSSGRVLLAGGNFFEAQGWGGMGWYPAPGGDVYDPWQDRWTPTPAEPHYVMYRSAAVALPGGEALHVGGILYDDSNFDNGFHMFSLDTAQLFRE